ncbi:MAG: hypothetical protein ACLQDY_31915 [Streptosporangiaceae bacterium]
MRWAAQLRGYLFSERAEVPGMPAPRVIKVAGPFQLVEGVLPDRLEHAHPWLAVGSFSDGDQADVQQPGGQLQRIGPGRPPALRGDGCQRIEVAAAGEHPHPAEHSGKLSVQQLVAPRDGVPEGLLPGRAPRSTRIKAQTVPEPGQQRPGCQQPGPGCGQLDRQRQPVQAPADRCHVRGVRLGDREVRPDHRRLLDEQPRRAAGRHLRCTWLSGHL